MKMFVNEVNHLEKYKSYKSKSDSDHLLSELNVETYKRPH